jgi:hypothetical protein
VRRCCGARRCGSIAATELGHYPASVALDIASEPFAFYGIHMICVVEPGGFEIMVGNSSCNSDLPESVLTLMN